MWYHSVNMMIRSIVHLVVSHKTIHNCGCRGRNESIVAVLLNIETHSKKLGISSIRSTPGLYVTLKLVTVIFCLLTLPRLSCLAHSHYSSQWEHLELWKVEWALSLEHYKW